MTPLEAYIQIQSAIACIRKTKQQPIRVAINGIEGTGKTTFAIRLVEYLRAQNVEAYHVSIDGFHFNKEIRYRQGRDSADGYYEDSYDEYAFVKSVLRQSQKNPPSYIEATHDLETDVYLNLKPKKISNDAVLICDGCYMFKPVFNEYWELRAYLKTDFQHALERGALRDQEKLGGYDHAKQRIETRYHLSSRRYNLEVNPEALADIIFDNTDFEDLKRLRAV